MNKIIITLSGIMLTGIMFSQTLYAQKASTHAQEKYNELYRPQYHFTPAKNWNNDPNGLVYYKGEYHLFYQYYPKAMEWGPMHWGHAVSTDLFHWKNLPIALYPDSIGYIFSGSAVVDKNNTAGFQKGNEKALVAIFTYHNPKTNIESQAIAYSTDKGRTWTKYKGNPVISGKKDFRDPKVRWYEPMQKWVMVVSAHDHIAFYSSSNLKSWTHESDFGKGKGSHGGVWECPDLFPLKINGSGKEKWILTVNNGGSPDGGRGTQYFIGNFDGHQFTADDNKTRWLEGGADEYAGITWSNTANRTIFIGWIDNWPPKNMNVPSYTWRGGMTLPVELSLKRINDSTTFLVKQPVKELKKLEQPVFSSKNIRLSKGAWEKTFTGGELSSAKIRLKAGIGNALQLKVSLKNDSGQYINILYDRQGHQLIIDRTHADRNDLHAGSARKHAVEIPTALSTVEMQIFYDRSTVEVFFDKGRLLTADLVFPGQPYNRLEISTMGNQGKIDKLKISTIQSVWEE